MVPARFVARRRRHRFPWTAGPSALPFAAPSGLGTGHHNKEAPMEGVTVVEHPMVQHKLTLMRDKERSTKGFRQLLSEVGRLLCYEITRDLPLELVEIETPLTHMQAPRLAGKK